MVPGKYNITITRGGTFDLNVQATDGIGSMDFSAVYTSARMQIRPAWVNKPGMAPIAPLLELTTANGRIIFNGQTINLGLNAEETAALKFNSGVYELELVVDGEIEIVDKLLAGSVTVTGEITV